jgi:DNA-binding MarR family transcriptional regulator
MVKKTNKADIPSIELKEPEAYPGYLLWQASNIWNRNMKSFLKKFGTTHIQFVVLSSLLYLSKQNKSINQKQIAHQAKLDIMMTSDVLKTLEAKKLVIRVKNPKDRRHNSIKITRKGSRLVAKMIIQAELADAKFFQILENDIKSLTDPLEKLISANYDNIYFHR